MTLEELIRKNENKIYAEAQDKCMKQLLSYRNMKECEKECETYYDKATEFNAKVEYCKSNNIYVPLFFNDSKRRIDKRFTKNFVFCWILSDDTWGIFHDGRIERWTYDYAERKLLKPTEELYTEFLSQFPIIEREFDAHLEERFAGY